ncbi:hypothetical protein V8G54_030643 [Vigna mungo]|uniref:Uncharacterized protein n=1 Tax=Vigna mungo TaxID=3915 RepID=A0AAQ3MW22_VIGMU
MEMIKAEQAAKGYNNYSSNSFNNHTNGPQDLEGATINSGQYAGNRNTQSTTVNNFLITVVLSMVMATGKISSVALTSKELLPSTQCYVLNNGFGVLYSTSIFSKTIETLCEENYTICVSKEANCNISKHFISTHILHQPFDFPKKT